jgi:hypothetical protein
VVKRALVAECRRRWCWRTTTPRGLAEPSRADEYLTQTLKPALALVDVRVLDHVWWARAAPCPLPSGGCCEAEPAEARDIKQRDIRRNWPTCTCCATRLQPSRRKSWPGRTSRGRERAARSRPNAPSALSLRDSVGPVRPLSCGERRAWTCRRPSRNRASAKPTRRGGAAEPCPMKWTPKRCCSPTTV